MDTLALSIHPVPTPVATEDRPVQTVVDTRPLPLDTPTSFAHKLADCRADRHTAYTT